MSDHDKYTLPFNADLIDVLKKIDTLSNTQTVFIKDKNGKIFCSITDGDIRRGFINGLSLSDSILDFANKNFSFIKEGENNYDKLKTFREKKLKAVPIVNDNGQLIKIINFSKVKSILPIDAVIMAGGMGKRLKPRTNTVPKPLLKIGGKEIISYNIDRLHQFGIDNQYVTINYLADQIEEFCSNYNDEINFQLIREKGFIGTAGGLSLIQEFYNDTVLLMNSDLLTNINYEDFYKSFLEKKADMMVASIPYPINLPYAIFELNNSDIVSFKEKPSYTYYANAGIYLIKKDLIKLIPKNVFFNATDLMELVINSNKKLIHYAIRGYWLDIGKNEDFEKAQRDIAHINWD